MSLELNRGRLKGPRGRERELASRIQSSCGEVGGEEAEDGGKRKYIRGDDTSRASGSSRSWTGAWPWLEVSEAIINQGEAGLASRLHLTAEGGPQGVRG
jgi:hypothetical protein